VLGTVCVSRALGFGGSVHGPQNWFERAQARARSVNESRGTYQEENPAE